ncbi:MAG: universal stress protein [Ardenticatenaceae bacterium]|nr:universal stress protein [Ardenticatenaceae bacterium]
MRILIAVNTGKQGATAVAWGNLLAQFTGATPTLLTVVKQKSMRRQAGTDLEKMAEMMTTGPVVPPIKVAVGRIVDEIVYEANNGQYDLLVVGTRPFPSLIKRFSGQVTERVLQQAPCPIFIAKNNPEGLHRFLICEGGREPSLLKRFITKLPMLIQDGTEIKILHVMSQILANPAGTGWELQADAQALIEGKAPEGELLQEDVKLLAVAPIPVFTEIRHGLVVDEIVAEAGNGRYDLIVIGRHQGNGWWLADLMNQIVAQADRSVLVI